METWTNKFHLNREGEAYPPGPWNDEPDKAVWVDETTDLDCMINRGPLGALCGYVGVGPDHPYHGKDYDTINPDVHGGLTFSDPCAEGDDPADGICHVPQPGRPDDVWWFGFDCGHYMDVIPGMIEVMAGIEAKTTELIGPSDFSFGNPVYRGFDYVKGEVTTLATQLAEAS